MTNQEVIRIAQGLITDFKCESETMVEFCNAVIKALSTIDMIKSIINMPHVQEDVIRYKMICEVMENE